MQTLESSRNQCLAHNPPPLRDGISADSLVPRGPEPVMDLVFAANGPANVQMELCGVGHIPLHSRCSSSQMCTHNKKVSMKTQTATDPSGFRWSKNWRHKDTKLSVAQNKSFVVQQCRGPPSFTCIYFCKTWSVVQGGSCITRWPLLLHSVEICKGNKKTQWKGIQSNIVHNTEVHNFLLLQPDKCLPSPAHNMTL